MEEKEEKEKKEEEEDSWEIAGLFTAGVEAEHQVGRPVLVIVRLAELVHAVVRAVDRLCSVSGTTQEGQRLVTERQ